MRTDVRRPLPTIAVMFGMPSRMAHDDGDEPSRDEDNEDNLGREDDSEHFDNGDGATNTLDLLYERLKQGDETAGHAAMSIARCIQEMANQAARRNKAGLKHWYDQCCELIAHIDGDDGEQRDE